MTPFAIAPRGPGSSRFTTSDKLDLQAVGIFDKQGVVLLAAVRERVAVVVRARDALVPTVFAQRIDVGSSCITVTVLCGRATTATVTA